MRFSSLFVAFSTISIASSAYASAPQQSLAEQYKSCTQLSALKPKETLERAQKWYAESGQLAAQHCMALAQFELQDYDGAASSLETILMSVDQTQGALWFSMKKQAARAYLNSGNGQPAERHLTDALRFASDKGMNSEMVPLLIDRANLYAAKNEHLRAIQDLDHALTLQNTAPVVLERAKVYLKMGDTKLAEQDIRAVLKADPLNEQASRMLGDLERRNAELKAEAEAKALAAQQAPVTNNYYSGGGGGGGESPSGGGNAPSAAPQKKLSFDERVAQARAERAKKYGWDK
ncbi:MAG: hypothetical protein FJX23_05555 [Alphaproteobacteria bacterium]|nr:hypothetical protein [Alphaproteobacteria bacterium]